MMSLSFTFMPVYTPPPVHIFGRKPQYGYESVAESARQQMSSQHFHDDARYAYAVHICFGFESRRVMAQARQA